VVGQPFEQIVSDTHESALTRLGLDALDFNVQLDF
jgi:hypothetical protein